MTSIDLEIQFDLLVTNTIAKAMGQVLEELRIDGKVLIDRKNLTVCISKESVTMLTLRDSIEGFSMKIIVALADKICEMNEIVL